MTTDVQLARIAGIPIRLHLLLLVLFPIFAFQLAPTGEGALPWLWGGAAALLLFASVALHELGHALTALSLGIRTREIILLPIGGTARLEQIPRRPRHELLLAAAGPATSLILTLFFWIGAYLIYFRWHWPAGSRLLAHIAVANFWLACFNLLPAFPMDGGRVLRAALAHRLGRLRATRIAAGIGQVLAAVLGIIGAYPPLNLLLIGIAFFIYTAAGAELRQVSREEQTLRSPNREAALDNLVTISPSPFQKGSADSLATLQVIRRRWPPFQEDGAHSRHA